MKLKVAFTLIIVSFFSLINGQSADDQKMKANIVRNRIKIQVNLDYKYIGEKPEKKGTRTSLTTYTGSGDILQVTSFNPKGQVLHVEKYTYDSKGNRTGYTRYTSGDESKAAYQKISKYNSQGLIGEESGFDGVDNFRNLYVYDDKGDMSEIRYMKNNVLYEKRIFNRKDNITTVAVYNASGNMISKLQLKYDANNNLIEETVYGGNQSELEKKTYNYDDQEKLTEEAKYTLSKITLRTIYQYNSKGDLTEIIEETPGTERFVKKSYAYDPVGNILEIKWRRRKDEPFNRITYTYDPKGICTTSDTEYPATKYRVLTRYEYEFY
jgi:YD repeat-containing protein